MRAGVAAAFVASAFMAGTAPTQASGLKEHWSCEGMSLTATCGPDDDPYVLDGCRGTVKVGDFPSQDVWFYIKGVQRVWNWCLDLKDFGYDCTFVINSDGWGRYYDFSGVEPGGTTKPQDVMQCEKVWR